MTSVPPYRRSLATTQDLGQRDRGRRFHDDGVGRAGRSSSAGQSSKLYGGSHRARSNARAAADSSHPGSAARTMVTGSSPSPTASRFRRTAANASGSRSTKVDDAAPRDKASTPSAPLPQKRSTTGQPFDAALRAQDVEDRLAHPVRRRAHRRRQLGGQPAPAAPASDDPHRAHPTAARPGRRARPSARARRASVSS